MTVAKIAETLKLNQQTVRNWIDGGKLPAIHVGRRVRVTRTDFKRFVEHGYSGMSTPSSAEASSTARGFWDGTEHPLPESPGA